MPGPKCGHYSSHPWAIIYVRPGALGEIRHQRKSLSYVAESNLLTKMYLLTSKKVEGSLSKHLCSTKDDQRYSIVHNVKNIYLFA